jgi:lipopolysaccharide transport system permease protein
MLSSMQTCMKDWRLIHLLGLSSLRVRYARSKLGQSWLTISLFIQIISTGVVWSILWHMAPHDFLPYLAISQTIYQLFATIIIDSTSIFVTDSRLYINQYLPFLTSVLSNIYKNLIIFLHNIPIILIIALWFKIPITFSFAGLFTLPLLVLFLISTSYVIGCLCTRYRDIMQIVQALMNISFLVTPIVWQMSYIPEQFRNYFFISPLTSFLEIYRNSLLGMPINSWAYISATLWTAFVFVLMLYTHRRFEKRIVFWI